MSGDLVTFLRRILNKKAEDARGMRDSLLRSGIPEGYGIDPAVVGRFQAVNVYEADVLLALLEETIVPYLGTAGPVGRIAERQLRILGSPYRHEAGYDADWLPDA